MNKLREELTGSFDLFAKELRDSYVKNFDELDKNKKYYLESYERLTSLQAWRAYIIEVECNKFCLDFFIEAQNDMLLSHCFARIGSWRGALKSMRSAIDNILFFVYYKDHHIEYRLWELGKHQLPISEYMSYIYRHPDFIKKSDKITGVELLKAEYPTLSKAVHGSSKSFRMTKDGNFPNLMASEIPLLNQWVAREKEVIKCVNLLLMAIFNHKLKGAAMRNLRKSISFSVPEGLHSLLLEEMEIRLFTVD